MEYANLNSEELKRKLVEVDSNRAALERALRARQKEQRGTIVQQIRELIHDNGYELDEIVALLTRRRRGTYASTSAGSSMNVGTSASSAALPAAAPAQSETKNTDKARRYYVDLENPDHTYSRGVLPQWMKRKMLAQGLDPDSKADRESFKNSNMRLVVES